MCPGGVPIGGGCELRSICPEGCTLRRRVKTTTCSEGVRIGRGCGLVYFRGCV
jgi:hypothetical protein